MELPPRLVESAAFQAGCAGKGQRPSWAAAIAGMEFLQRTGVLRTGDGLDVYQCDFCREWHLGH